MSKTEEWRPVVGYEGIYEVSDRARVRSLPRFVTQRGRYGMITRPVREKGPPRPGERVAAVPLAVQGRPPAIMPDTRCDDAITLRCDPGHESVTAR